MPTIAKIEAHWFDWHPENIQSPWTGRVNREYRFTWGVARSEPPHGLGFVPASVPRKAVPLGAEFSIGDILVRNFPHMGPNVSDVQLALEFHFSDGTKYLAVTRLLVISEANVLSVMRLRFDQPLPLRISDVLFELEITGFGSDHKPEIAAARGVVRDELRGRLIRVGEKQPDPSPCQTGEFVPAFSVSKCRLPPLCPIDEIPLVKECELPEPPSPIMDCPDLDLIMPTLAGTATVGPPGPPGSPGPPGPPGCTPQVSVSYEERQTAYCDGPPVDILAFRVGQCSVHLHFVFYTCRKKEACCYYICCKESWEIFSGGDHCLLYHDPDPPTPTEFPVLRPPTPTCNQEGITITVCHCSPLIELCLDVGCSCGPECFKFPDTIHYSITNHAGDPCSCLAGSLGTSGKAYWNGDKCWNAGGSSSCNIAGNIFTPMVSLCCIAGIEWTIKLSCGTSVAEVGAQCGFTNGTCWFEGRFLYEELKQIGCCLDDPQVDPGAEIIVRFMASSECSAS